MVIHNLANRPDLLEPALALGDIGAEFMQHDPIGDLTRARRLARRWPEFFLVVLDEGEPVARAVGIPLAFPAEDRTELPEHGWDGAILWAVQDALDGRAPTALCALDVQVARARRGQGVAAAALTALRECAREQGLSRLVVPVRPTGKRDHPRVPMAEYLTWRRADGLPGDPWLRTHERLGARLVKIAPFAMTITGTLAQWRDWTGLALADGENEVDGGLVPVLASTAQDVGVYVEPNVWLEHPL
ncbi:Acetyltransferase (GNAT) family protein [Amycolatopsis marina]|uniref:Acetyltransferase (GNAT) family protein n=1 Tax=Amycolatopsis marina TaxID=490629 RepID=A0A1I0Y2N6_9PSEU|nr:GNAT family N-acetyltransferase [Amycolatopsis marina]SFB06926.1 Acetyltransferase (GNAT) family protein [Amycolatopsis marina]